MSDIIMYGNGKTGKSAVKMLERQGIQAKVYVDNGENALDGRFKSDTTVIVSPGVKPTANGIIAAQKAGAYVVGELEYCFGMCKGKCISVTGTNGKTTTCQMIYHILRKYGATSYLLGNGGVPFSEKVLDVRTDDVVVLESSSFQLSYCERFAPFVSVFTNFAPDHLDYHGSIEAYAKAKINNFIHQTSGYAIFNIDDANTAEFSKLCRCHVLTFSLFDKKTNCYCEGNNVVLSVGRGCNTVACERLSTLSKHNRYNTLAACLACYCVGVPFEFSLDALEDYVLLPHRLQKVASIGKVDFVDDSKATNVHATLSALDNYTESIALILGGSDKGEQFDAIFERNKSKLVKVTAVGATADKIADCAEKYGVHTDVFVDIKQAVTACYGFIKETGGTVLMSNACASFDMFGGYEERGDYFQKVVGELYDSEQKN